MLDSDLLLVKSWNAWWADAGLTSPASDEAFGWLKEEPEPLRRAALPADEAKHVAPVKVEQFRPLPPASAQTKLPAVPTDLPAFDGWLGETADLPGVNWGGPRILPTGPVSAPLMIISDTPDMDDFPEARLFSSAKGALLDAMLAAIGMARADLRIASIALTRPPGGILDGEEAKRLTEIALHHIRIANPAQILLLGQQASELLTGQPVAPDGKSQREINHDGVTRAVFTAHHPRLLIDRPQYKRPAWEALKAIKELS